MIYNSKGGINYRDVLDMTTKERSWFLDRLNRQITDENEARKQASKGLAKPKKKPVARRRR